MVRPKVAICLAISLVLLIVLLGGLHHGGNITLPLEKVKELVGMEDVVGWEDIEMPHNESPQFEDSLIGDVRNETSSQGADLLEEDSVIKPTEVPKQSPTQTLTYSSTTEPAEQELTLQTSSPIVEPKKIDPSAVRIYIGVVHQSYYLILTVIGNSMVELRAPFSTPRSLQTLPIRPPRHRNTAIRPGPSRRSR